MVYSEGRCDAGLRRTIVAAMTLAAVGGLLFTGTASAAPSPAGSDVRTLVTRWYVHGVPYAEAKAFGAGAIPELVSILKDPAMAEHWTKVVWILGCIGDSSATGPLFDFLKGQRGEISADAFRATLAVLPALGHLAREGDEAAFGALKGFTRPGAWKDAELAFSYRRYSGDALGEVLGRTAIQGLGIAGTPDALLVLESLHRKGLRDDWRDNVEEALALNNRVNRMGPGRAFVEEEEKQ